jgi:DNA sulfur modification protein DndC
MDLGVEQQVGSISFEEDITELWEELVDGVRQEYLSEQQNHPWIIGFSGGKDSSLVTHAVFEAITRVSPSRRKREIHVLSNDTLVESPFVIAHLDQVTAQIEKAARGLGLPITVARTVPDPDKTFWVLLIGKGYPSPNSTMRWCTDRLKIVPTSSYIKAQVARSGSAIILLGVRKDESQARQRTIEKFRNKRGGVLSEHDRLPGALIYRPIMDVTLDQVWELLSSIKPPWGNDHRALIQLYRDSEGGECPVVISADDAPGCGTSNSRFGCWTCTVVEKDKSLQGFVDAGKIQYAPLIEFRDWLKKIRNDQSRRQAIRRNGKVTVDKNGRHVPGPFTIDARREILDRLLELEKEFGGSLISRDEIARIHQHWADELNQGRTISDG